MAEWYLDDIVTTAAYADHEYALNYITGAHANLPEFMADVHPLQDVDDAEAYLERLRGVAGQLQQVAANLAAERGAWVPATHRRPGSIAVADRGTWSARPRSIRWSAFGDLFRTLPSSAIEVQRPRPGRESDAGAYYRAPPAVGERAGIYYLSLGGEFFPLDTYATTNYHEAVPGHHFQLALQRESAGLPWLQRATSFNGYAEGWALYAERLAYEAGLYEDDPLGDIGRLRMELLRAARAVADTAIHALGWSRHEAIEYLMEQGFPEGWAASEVDRYIVWPGQAPAYLIGMLEILELRDEAQARLGDDFDLAAFHEAVLRHGSVPLEVLPMAVGAYIDEASAVATLSAGMR